MTTPALKPFHQWKDEQVKKDSAANGVFRHYRAREWYHAAYGTYVRKFRAEAK